MLDTLKIAIPLVETQFNRIQYILSNRDEFQWVLHNPVTNEFFIPIPKGAASEKNKRFRKPINYAISPRYVEDKTFLFFELSLPKFAFYHNIVLLYDWLKPLYEIREILNNELSIELPPVKSWLIKRLDICYAYRFPTQELAQSYLNSLKHLEFPQKTKSLHETTIIYKGKTFSFEIYLKKPEFIVNDSKFLIKQELPLEALNYLESLAEGVLRVEFRFLSGWLKRNKINTISDIVGTSTRITIESETSLEKDEKQELANLLYSVTMLSKQNGTNTSEKLSKNDKTTIKDGETVDFSEGKLVFNGKTYHIPKSRAIFEVKDKIVFIAQDYLNQFIRGNAGMDNKYDVKERLKSCYRQEKALLLFNFWLHLKEMGMAEAKKEYTKPTYYRNVSELKKAGISLIGIHSEDLTHEFFRQFNLEIPSPFVVNQPGQYPEGQFHYFPETVNQ